MSRGPEIGDPAPDFTLPSTQGEISLFERVRDNGVVLLVFYPKDNTLVCTRQLCNYRDNLSLFDSLGVDVIGINHDAVSTHQAFSEKYKLPFPLVSDVERTTCEAYGALVHFLKAKRTLVLIGSDGRVWWKHSELRAFHRTAQDLREIISELKLEAVV